MKRHSSKSEDLMKALFCTLSEKDRRRYAAVEAQKLGWGGIEYISELLGIDSRSLSGKYLRADPTKLLGFPVLMM